MTSSKRPLFGALGFLLAAVLIVEIALAIWLPIREKNNEEITPVKGAKPGLHFKLFVKMLNLEHHLNRNRISDN